MKVRQYKVLSVVLIVFVVLSCHIYVDANTATPLLNLGRKWYDTPVDVYFNCDFDTDERNAVSAAMDKWNSVKDPDGNSIVTMHLTDGLAFNYVQYGYLPGNTVGYCDLRPTSGEEISAVTVYLNDSCNWSTTGDLDAYDIQTVVMHELGHALGIAHCHESSEGDGPCWSATCLDNIMNPFTGLGDVNYTFQPYDTASYMMIYYW